MARQEQISYYTDSAISRNYNKKSLRERIDDAKPSLAAFIIVGLGVAPWIVDHVPGNNSKNVKPPTTTEQVVENNTQTADNINLAK
jgi:hypothetical protein